MHPGTWMVSMNYVLNLTSKHHFKNQCKIITLLHLWRVHAADTGQMVQLTLMTVWHAYIISGHDFICIFLRLLHFPLKLLHAEHQFHSQSWVFPGASDHWSPGFARNPCVFFVFITSPLYNNTLYFLEINKLSAILIFLFPTFCFKWSLLILPWNLIVSFLVFYIV